MPTFLSVLVSACSSVVMFTKSNRTAPLTSTLSMLEKLKQLLANFDPGVCTALNICTNCHASTQLG